MDGRQNHTGSRSEPKWGDWVSEARELELRELYQASVQSANDNEQPDVFAGRQLTGADLFCLAAMAAAGSIGTLADARDALEAARYDHHARYLIDLKMLHLQGADLRHASLEHATLRYLDLRRADLSGAQLAGAFLYGVQGEQAQFQGASLAGVNMRRAKLEDSNFAGATLTDADLKSADLARSDLNMAIADRVDLRRANLNRANLSGAIMDFANLQGASLQGAVLFETSLANAQFQNAILSDAMLVLASLVNAQFGGAILTHANLRKANLAGANAERTRLDHAQLQRAHLESVNLAGSDLEAANLDSAVLPEASLQNCHLVGASLMGATLAGADLRGANLSAAKLGGVVLTDINNIAPKVADARWDGAIVTVIDWTTIRRLGDESSAARRKAPDGKRKGALARAHEYQAAARAYRQLGTALRSQGLSIGAIRFHYRAEVAERKHLYLRAIATLRASLNLRRLSDAPKNVVTGTGLFVRWLISLALGVLIGYGDYIARLFVAYFVVVTAFAFVFGVMAGEPLTFGAARDALVLSLTSFHGRGLAPTGYISDSLRSLAAVEGVVGLLFDGLIVAAFTRRVMGT